MYCSKCGKEMSDDTQFCPYCGQSTAGASESAKSQNEEKYNVCAIVGFILSLVSLFISIYGMVNVAAVIVSAIGLIQTKERGESGSSLAIAGIIIGSLAFLLVLIIIALFGSMLSVASCLGY